MMIDVAPSVENVDDLNPIRIIEEEDDIALMPQGANVVTQFRPMAAKNTGKASEMIAARHQLGDKGLSYGDVAAFLCDITQDIGQIVFGRGQVGEVSHLDHFQDGLSRPSARKMVRNNIEHF
jgi:hypothetical protein